ncbi:MAG: lipocalin family protein [Saprospiraceae bacterium]|nr:lipocalin family protein [Saprospiraceae bacterium]
MLKYSFITVFSLVGVLACQQHSPEALTGSWKAISVVEENDTLDLDLSNVNLTFNSDMFLYQHTQKDSMRGTFSLKRGLINLYVQKPEGDTIVIQLTELTDSELILRMNHEGKERFVTFIR